MSKNTRNRILLTAVAALLLVVVAVGGTIAYLVDTTNEVKNTFTPSTIDISLVETKQPDGTEKDEDNDGKKDPVTNWSAQVIPGVTLNKNPIVTVWGDEDNVDIYLFIEVDSVAKIEAMQTSGVFEDFTMFYADTDTWKLVAENVYYATVTASTSDWSKSLINGDKLVVDTDATQAKINALFTNVDDIVISFQAYACQVTGFEDDVAGAWAAAQAAGAYGKNPY